MEEYFREYALEHGCIGWIEMHKKYKPEELHQHYRTAFYNWHKREVETLTIPSVSNNEAESEVAFCDSPIHDFDRCPFIVQRNDCKDCRYYN